MKVFSFTSKGIRETNEDYIKSERLSSTLSLHIIADGMGGYQYGEEASKTATEAIFQFIAENTIEKDIPIFILHAIKFANSHILTLKNQYHTKLGTTLAGVLIIDDISYAFWLGDVQIQLFRDTKQIFISESHTLINEMKKNGTVSVKEIERYKHVVTKSISGNTIIDTISIHEIKILPQDVFIISTDGFYNFFKIDNSVIETNAEFEIFVQNNLNRLLDNASCLKIIV